MKRVYKAAFAAGTVVFAVAASGPTILGKKIDKKDICPGADTSKCVQSSGRGTAAAPIYIEKYKRDLAITGGEPRYWDLLGKQMTKTADKNTLYCGADLSNPFEQYAAAKGIKPYITTTGSPLTIERQGTKVFNLGGNADLAKVADAAGIPTGNKLVQTKAALKAARDKLRTTDFSLTGTYVYVEIDPLIVAALGAAVVPAELQSCAAWLKEDKKNQMFASMTGLIIDSGTLKNTVDNTIDATLDASLGSILTAGELGALKIEYKKTVTQQANIEFKPMFRTLSVAPYRPYF